MPDSSSSDERDISSSESDTAGRGSGSASQNIETPMPSSTPQVNPTATQIASSAALGPGPTSTVPQPTAGASSASRRPAFETVRVKNEAVPGSFDTSLSETLLPVEEFPSNATSDRHNAHKQPNTPIMLSSLAELEALLDDIRGRHGFSNYEDVSVPSHSAQTPILPTFERFSSTLLATMENVERRVVESDRTETGAVYDMSYPINLSVTDKRNIPLPGLPVEGIPDSQGYPLLYNFEGDSNPVGARSSAALYPVNLSRGLAQQLSSYPDKHLLKTWAHMFQLSDEKDAQAILLQRVQGAHAGDNHIVLLLKAYLAYFDSIAAGLDGMEFTRNSLSPTSVVIDVRKQAAWSTQVLGSSAEAVNVLGHSYAYQQFWAYCCFPSPPIYASKSTENGRLATSPFSFYTMEPGLEMVCLCDKDVYSVSNEPLFFGKPNDILGHIETYVQSFGLQQQANEALQIAMLWPTLVLTEAHISLPRPLHTIDWLGSEVERPTITTAYGRLVAARHFSTLASTLAGAWAMQSQMYDYVTLITSRRNSWALSRQTLEGALSWLTTNMSAPGVGWDFLLGHQFKVTPSFLYLTGLAVEVVDWQRLLDKFTWKEKQFPAHLRLFQAFWVKTSVCCRLPWEDAWVPQINVSADRLVGSPLEIMSLLRLALLDTTAGGIGRATASEGIFALLHRVDEDETIEINPECIPMLYAVLDKGVRVKALPRRPRALKPRAVFLAGDPMDRDDARNAWRIAASGSSSTKDKGKGKSSRR